MNNYFHIHQVIFKISCHKPLVMSNSSIQDDLFTLQVNIRTYPLFSLSKTNLIFLQNSLNQNETTQQCLLVIQQLFYTFPEYDEIFIQNFIQLAQNFTQLTNPTQQQFLTTLLTSNNPTTVSIIDIIPTPLLTLSPLLFYKFVKFQAQHNSFKIDHLLALQSITDISEIIEILWSIKYFRIIFDTQNGLFPSANQFENLEDCPNYFAFQMAKPVNLAAKNAARLGVNNEFLVKILRNLDEEGEYIAELLESGEMFDLYDDL